MSKPLVPTRTLFSSFSRTLRSQNHRQFFGTRTRTSTVPLSTQPQICFQAIGAKRAFTTTEKKSYKTVEEAKSRYRSGPFSYTAGLIFLLSGIGLVAYFRYEKARMERKRIAEATKGIGKPKVGGEFTLVDQNGHRWDSVDKMRGRYCLVYFGFSHCPDICPEELDKMAEMIDQVNSSTVLKTSKLPPLLPIFITCDPARDTPGVLKEYLTEFHKDLIGLTGTWDEIKDVCKKYRVYFSTPSDVKKGDDYLVDHSIYFYLMDPEGDFVEAIGRQFSPEQAAGVIEGHLGDWRKR